MKKTPAQPPALPEIVVDERQYRRRSRRSILMAAIAGAFGLAGFEWIKHTKEDRELHWILRKGLNAGDALFGAGFRNAKAPNTGAPADPIRTNGDEGLEDSVDARTWRLSITEPGRPEPLKLTLDDLKRLPAIDISFEFKCIEGWSQNVQCRGARFSDFMHTYDVGWQASIGAKKVAYKYALLTSINGGYYVSMDMKSLMHPQTLLCYDMSGKPLEDDHGFPLRLMTPVKYGVKNIKQIGSIAFTDSLPKDFWAERGYSDTSGL